MLLCCISRLTLQFADQVPKKKKKKRAQQDRSTRSYSSGQATELSQSTGSRQLVIDTALPSDAPPPPPPGFSGIYDGGKQGEYGFESEPPEPELLDPRWLLDAAAVQQPHNRRDGSPRNLTKQYLQLSGPMWA